MMLRSAGGRQCGKRSIDNDESENLSIASADASQRSNKIVRRECDTSHSGMACETSHHEVPESLPLNEVLNAADVPSVPPADPKISFSWSDSNTGRPTANPSETKLWFEWNEKTDNIRLEIKSAYRDNFSALVRRNMRIEALKRALSRLFRQDDFRMFYYGRELESGRTIEEYDIEDEERIDVVPLQVGC